LDPAAPIDALNDDLTIPDDAELWRRIPPRHFHLEGDTGRVRPASSAFEDDRDGSPMSVFLGALTSGPGEVLQGHEGYALASITAGIARIHGQAVVRDPLPDAPAHALVVGHKTRSIRAQLAIASRWIAPPPEQW
jgi:hypothetical protein